MHGTDRRSRGPSGRSSRPVPCLDHFRGHRKASRQGPSAGRGSLRGGYVGKASGRRSCTGLGESPPSSTGARTRPARRGSIPSFSGYVAAGGSRPVTTSGQARRRAGLSQRGMVEATDIPRSTLARLEAGRSASIELVERVLAVAGLVLVVVEEAGSEAGSAAGLRFVPPLLESGTAGTAPGGGTPRTPAGARPDARGVVGRRVRARTAAGDLLPQPAPARGASRSVALAPASRRPAASAAVEAAAGGRARAVSPGRARDRLPATLWA